MVQITFSAFCDSSCASGKAGLTSSLVSETTSDKDELECELIVDSSCCSSLTPSNDYGDAFGETSPEAHDSSVTKVDCPKVN